VQALQRAEKSRSRRLTAGKTFEDPSRTESALVDGTPLRDQVFLDLHLFEESREPTTDQARPCRDVRTLHATCGSSTGMSLMRTAPIGRSCPVQVVAPGRGCQRNPRAGNLVIVALMGTVSTPAIDRFLICHRSLHRQHST
jgi:hypothetical protein